MPEVVRGPMEIRRGYQISLGPWTWQFSAPESLDLFDIADRVRSVFGMLAILGVAFFLSDNRRAISGRVIFWGLVLARARLPLWRSDGLRGSCCSSRPARAWNRCSIRRSPGRGSSSATRWSATPARPGSCSPSASCRPWSSSRHAVRGALSPGHHAVGRARVRDHHGLADGHERGRVAERRRVAVPGPDRSPADDPPLPAPPDQVRAAHRDDLGHGPRLGRRDRGVCRRRGRGATHPHGRDHDGPRLDPALEDPGPRDRDARDPGNHAQGRAPRPMPTCSTRPLAGPATACNWR